MTALTLNAADARYTARLRERLGNDAPAQISTLGNLDLLALPKTALFCSTRCPGEAILRTYDQAARWRDAGRCIISGFHSPVEKECRALLSINLQKASNLLKKMKKQGVILRKGERRWARYYLL
ncbi:MAG: hypothetical protein HZA15_03735 [Nitrospirae bacterium]|nr:hypothetical protein [Nitrospirota bacterium]